VNERLGAWLSEWGRVLPLLIAEATIWIGFGALLPILPLYFTEHGVDLPMLGVIVAAWPATRLVGEPFFGWVADRVSRKLMMVVGLLLASVFAVLPLFAVAPLAFILLRGLAGLAAAIYDPAARGYLVDANPPEKRGEAFGLYGAAQMGGFMLGPVVGGFAAALVGEATVVFWVAGLSLVASALLVIVFVPEVRVHVHEQDEVASAEAAAAAGDGAVRERRPARLLNRLLVAGVVLNLSAFFASGSYEVAWSLYLTSLGAGPDAIGVTFFSFAFPILVASSYFGRFADRHGGFVQMVVGLLVAGICGTVYTLVPQVWFIVVVGLVEGAAFAAASPALYLLVARASPVGRSSTAQGIFGAAGTLGAIIASLFSGVAAAADLRYPFYATTVAMLGTLAIGLVLGGRRLYNVMQPDRVPEPAGAVAVVTESVG
jgi:MFS family permease